MPKTDRGSAVIGVDPSRIHGKSGGGAISILTLKKGRVVGIVNICLRKNTERDILIKFRKAIRGKKCTAALEKVSARPNQGVVSMFNFGQGYGWLRSFLMCNDVPYEDVTPKKWQKFYGLYKEENETDTRWKNRLKSMAQQLFPNEKVTLGNADSLLLANYKLKN